MRNENLKEREGEQGIMVFPERVGGVHMDFRTVGCPKMAGRR